MSLENDLILKELTRLSKGIDNLGADVGELKTNVALNSHKTGRISAFFGALSGMLVAILTAVIINYTTNTKEIEPPKVIYKEELKKDEATL